jgi:hypothetical protein
MILSMILKSGDFLLTNASRKLIASAHCVLFDWGNGSQNQ